MFLVTVDKDTFFKSSKLSLSLFQIFEAVGMFEP